MTEEKWSKDAWILEAVAAGAIRVERDGTILKPAHGAHNLAFWKEVKLSTHKKTGRVYFQLTHANLTKSVLVNRVVALVYLPNPRNLSDVNHIDGVKAHNWLDCEKHPKSNLEWSSRADNEKHAQLNNLKTGRGSSNANAKLTAVAVIKIRQNPAASLSELAYKFSVSRKTIRDVLERKTWAHI